MISRVLSSQSKSVSFGAFLLAGSSLISSLLGLFRDRLLASQFGAGPELDMYFAAFRIPDFLYGILIMGGLSAAFLPVFSEYMNKDEKTAWRFAGEMLNFVIIVLGCIAILLFFLAPALIPLVVPGFSDTQQELTVSLTRIMLLSPILFGISAVLSSLLQYFNRFFAYALAPMLYNLGIIMGILFLVPHFGIRGLAYGVVMGALLHAFIQLIPALNTGFKSASLSFSQRIGIQRVFFLAFPRTIGAGAAYFTPIMMTALASSFTVGSIAIFTFANNLQMIPVGVIGISFSLAIFPALSRAFSQKKMEDFVQTFSLGFRQIVFLALPLFVLIFLLRAQLVRLILGSGKFGWEDTRLTSAALGIFAVGIIFQALIPFFMRTFFSLQNTKIPAVSSILALLSTLYVAFFFVDALEGPSVLGEMVRKFLHIEDISDGKVVALPLALVLGAIFQFLFLAHSLQRHIPVFTKSLFLSVCKVICASFLLGLVTFCVLQIFGTIFHLETFGEVFWQALLAGVAGILSFLAFAKMLGCKELEEFMQSFKKQFHGE